jgi:PAS domain S-box-containing protein
VKNNTLAKSEDSPIAALRVAILDSNHDVVSDQPSPQAEPVQDRDLLRALMENLPDQIYFKDRQSRFLKCSKALIERTGAKNMDAMLGKTDFDFFAEEHARPAFEDEQEIIRTGQPLLGKVEKEVWKNNRETWALTSKIPLRNEAGEIIGTFGISKDITKQMETESKLTEERNFLRTLIDNLPDYVYAKDINGRFIIANIAVARQLGFSSSNEIIGKTDFELFPHELAARYYAEEQEIIKSGQGLYNHEGPTVDASKAEKNRWVLTSKVALRDAQGEITGFIGIGCDITAIKDAEAKLAEVHKQLLQASRQAGMAEVATSVLHNVGNVLNSVNVASSCVADSLKRSKSASLSKVVALLREHQNDLGNFFANDPKGKQLPGYLSQLAEHLAVEQAAALDELTQLQKNIEHIKDIVAMQQNYSKSSGVPEKVAVTDLVEDAVRMNTGAMERHQVKVVREYSETPQISVEKHKVLQILVNLIRNAKYACDDSGRNDKQITLRVANGDGRIKISVIDNGVGIPAENMTRIFNHGFTTRENGHGFGLHSGALAAKEIRGSLTAFSEGPGRGATFTLELPVQQNGKS